MSKISPIRYFRSGISTFDELLLSHKGDHESNNGRGLAFYDNVGFLGTVFGAAGSGKSIFALQLAAICGNSHDHGSKGCVAQLLNSDGTPQSDNRFAAVYITQESAELAREKILGFGWIDAENIKIPGEPGFLDLAKHGLHLANFDLNQDSQADVLRNIFDAVARQQNSTIEGNNQNGRTENFTLICFDNAETILPAAYSDLVGSKPGDQNFYKSIRDFCRKRKLHLMMFFEEERMEGEDSSSRSNGIATTAQAYAADLVIQLGSHVFPSGYKERSFEIVKAKNQYHRRGNHHFSIVPGHEKSESVKDGGENHRRPGVVIYESLATQLHRFRDNEEAATHVATDTSQLEHGNFGISSLDAGIGRVIENLVGATARQQNGRTEHWRSNVVQQYLSPGSISVLVSDLDVRAHEIGLHFAFRPQDPFGGETRLTSDDAVYISFLHSWATLREVLNGFTKTAKFDQAKPRFFRQFQPEHISEAKLLLDIRELISRAVDENRKKTSPVRVVIDNLYALQAKFPLIQNAEHFITALFAQLRNLNVSALVLDTIDVGIGRNPLEESFAAGLAQNVFLLLHVELHSRSHTAFSVVQLLGKTTPPALWEIVDHGGELKALDTFRYYKNVLTGTGELVKVRMSLHADAENSPLDKYLNDKREALSSSVGHTLELHLYRPEQYTHVQSAFSFSRIQPFSDCHVISIDETWLEELLRKDSLEEISTAGRYRGAVTTCHDLAISYLESEPSGTSHISLDQTYAIPDRNNCGVLAVRRDKLNGLTAFEDATDRITDDFKRELLDFVSCDSQTWPELLELLIKYRRWQEDKKSPKTKGKSRNPDDPLFFTFCRDQAESCISFMLELALASVANGKKLVNNRELLFWSEDELDDQPWHLAINLFVNLLSREDQKEISLGMFRRSKKDPGDPTTPYAIPDKAEPQALFSRQWFNTCFLIGKNDQAADIQIQQLPNGNNGVPAVVSGAWYFGILKGSAGVAAGTEAIRQFSSPEETSPSEDLHKTNLGVGLPVRREYYRSDPPPIDLVHELPYRERFFELGQVDASHEDNKPTRVQTIASMCDSEFPFYRMRIKHYRLVAPIIWGIMVRAASTCKLNGDSIFALTPEENRAIRKDAQSRYKESLENADVRLEEDSPTA